VLGIGPELEHQPARRIELACDGQFACRQGGHLVLPAGLFRDGHSTTLPGDALRDGATRCSVAGAQRATSLMAASNSRNRITKPLNMEPIQSAVRETAAAAGAVRVAVCMCCSCRMAFVLRTYCLLCFGEPSAVARS